jgi:integrase/recombinase XerD
VRLAVLAKCVDSSYPFFATQKSVKHGFSANSLTQTLALLYRGSGSDMFKGGLSLSS